jgi:hypothetical protein
MSQPHRGGRAVLTHTLQRCDNLFIFNAALQTTEKLASILILGGAALQRCDTLHIFHAGFSR